MHISNEPHKRCIPLKEFLELIEKVHIISVLCHHGGQIIPSSISLGISRKSLYEKMKKYNIGKDVFKNTE